MTQAQLTLVTTTCIVLSGVSLVVGWISIRRRKIGLHKASMLTATGLAAVFLVAYVTRWYLFGSKPFEGEGGWRIFYVANLIPHIILAIAVGPLALRQIYLATGRGKNFAKHRRLGRITVPIWLYVAASGWLIYYLLYHF